MAIGDIVAFGPSGEFRIQSDGTVTLTGESLTIGDDLAITDDLSVGGDTALSGRLTTTDGVTSGTARIVGGLGYRSVAASTAITGATEVDTAFDATYTLPANTLKAGTVLRIRAQGIHTATTGAETHTMALKVGSVTVVTKPTIDPANNDIFFYDATVICRTAGASGTVVGCGLQAHGSPASATASPFALASTAIDTTATQAVGVWIDRQGTATDSDSARLDVLTVEVIG